MNDGMEITVAALTCVEIQLHVCKERARFLLL